MAQYTSYNAKDTTVIADGVFATGFAEDKIEFEPNEDGFEYEFGADGDVIVSESNDTSATVTITLQATSPSNKHFMNLLRQKRFFPLWAVSKRGELTEKAGGNKCRILKAPTGTLGTTAEPREYKIVVFDFENKYE